MGAIQEVFVPDIGDFKEVDVIEVLVKPGDAVAKEQSLISVESDKATMEIPSPADGLVKELRIKIGDKVSEGSLILLLESDAAAAAPSAQARAAEKPAAAPASPAPAPAPRAAHAPDAAAPGAPRHAPPVPIEPAAPGAFKPHASPSVRKFARELGVDLAQVKGSGPKNRILQADVQAFVKVMVARAASPAAAAAPGGGLGLNLPAWPVVDFAKFGPVETVPMSRIRKLSGPALARNWVTIPHVTNHDDADITELEAFRVQLNKENEKSGVKVTMLAFLIKACVAALKKFPDFNGSLGADGESIVRKGYYHIGFAADTPQGLVVPNVKDADKKGILEIAQETAELAKLARDGKLKPTDMQGGTFSISSLGGIGGTYFTPIINAPEVAILGVCKGATRPVWDGKQFAPRLILPMSLSWDHRVVDGAAAARFNVHLAQLLADFRRVML
jgi:pyruvate dehydrogenase E2 component (dihydrolipoamide acetyltransferase)